MRILALIHDDGPCTGVFGEVAAERGDEVEEWCPAWRRPPSHPLDEYQAVLVFGGVMHAHEEHHHPWLREENLLLQEFLDRRVPLFGVCLGGQLIAKAVHAEVARVSEPEIGWYQVELLPEAAEDPVFSKLPPTMTALQWHYYGFELPAGAVPLATSPVCLQAYRLGELAWGAQFHCEITAPILESWIDFSLREGEPDPELLEAMRRGIDEHMSAWNAVGREISGRFLALAEVAREARAA